MTVLTDKTELTEAPATGDFIHLVDVSDTTGSAAGTSKKIQANYLNLVVSRLTTTQKNALSAVNGMIVYDTTLNKFQGYENGSWTNII